MVSKAKIYSWVHVIVNGYMNHRPSYYGGWDPIEKGRSYVLSSTNNYSKERTIFLEKMTKYGVNWDKTDDIQSDTYSKFNGTFCDSSEQVYLEGWMTLNNGDSAFFCAENIDSSDVFGTMAMSIEYDKKAKEYFGEDYV